MRTFKLIITVFTFLATFLTGSNSYAQRAEILNPDFRTLKIEAENFMDIPVIRLGTNDRINIMFDQIGDEHSDLRYRLIHCNADWKKSNIIESEYIDGFNEVDIDDYAYSSNTFVHYINYSITLPDERMPVIASGNYILEVYDTYDTDNIILRAPLKISENLSIISGYATPKTDYGVNSEWQQLYFTIDPGMKNINPYSDLIVTTSQNSRADTERIIPSPMRISGNTLIFEHIPNLIYPASNEYRRFETVRTDYPGMHVDSVRWGGTNYHHYLHIDKPRTYSEYSYDQTQHGRFMIDEYNASDANLGGDYVTVHFTLRCPEIQGADVFVDGGFTHGIFNATNRMRYDYSDGAYHLAMPLKQGSYNYQYVVRATESESPASTSTIEGDKYETLNEYEVSVYFRPPGARADRLIGNAVIYTK